MKFVKKIDASNRIVVPTGIRDLLDVRAGDEVEFIVIDGQIVLRKPDYSADQGQKKIVAEQLRKYGYAVPPEFL